MVSPHAVSSQRFSLQRLKKRRGRHRRRLAHQKLHSRHMPIEGLEAREMLTVASDPDQTLVTGAEPLQVQLGAIDGGERLDLVALGANGDLTFASNGDDNTWQTVQTTDLGLGTLNGMLLAPVGFDPFADLVVQGPDSVSLLSGDGTGQFSLVDTVAPGAPGSLAPTGGGRVGMDVSLLDVDYVTDVVTVAPGSDEVLVFLGVDGTPVSVPGRYASGGDEPVVAAVGDVIGGPFPDVVVGHTDGSITWLEGNGDGTLQLRPELTVTGLDPVFDLTLADFDADGDTDVVVSGGTQVTLLSSDNDAVTSSPIVNGNFSAGLTGWEIQIVGHAADATPGAINALGGFAQLHENESFLVSLQQTFEIPPAPQTISFDIESLGLKTADAGVPDAFEVSLLGADRTSLVPAHRPEATSFFNANPGGLISTAAGVTFDGTNVTSF
jgi:hypothetical protein